MKKFSMGLVFGLVLAVSFSAMANSKIVAQYFNPTILVNGDKVILKSKPVTINGSTYLPMRELAETLNYNVQYEASSKTIKLNSKGENAVAPPSNNVANPTNPPKQEQGMAYLPSIGYVEPIHNKDKNVEYLTLKDLEKEGFSFTFNDGLLIEYNGIEFDFQQSLLDNWKNHKLGGTKKNNVMFYFRYYNDELYIDKNIIKAFK